MEHMLDIKRDSKPTKREAFKNNNLTLSSTKFDFFHFLC